MPRTRVDAVPDDLMPGGGRRKLCGTTKSTPRRVNVRGHGTGTEVQVQSNPTQPACAASDEAGHICKRQPGHPGVHEHYEGGQTISWANASGWFVAADRDEDGPYWFVTRHRGGADHGTDVDERKFDTCASAEYACEIMNQRGDR